MVKRFSNYWTEFGGIRGGSGIFRNNLDRAKRPVKIRKARAFRDYAFKITRGRQRRLPMVRKSRRVEILIRRLEMGSSLPPPSHSSKRYDGNLFYSVLFDCILGRSRSRDNIGHNSDPPRGRKSRSSRSNTIDTRGRVCIRGYRSRRVTS